MILFLHSVRFVSLSFPSADFNKQFRISLIWPVYSSLHGFLSSEPFYSHVRSDLRLITKPYVIYNAKREESKPNHIREKSRFIFHSILVNNKITQRMSKKEKNTEKARMKKKAKKPVKTRKTRLNFR